MWIARDKNNTLHLYTSKPELRSNDEDWFCDGPLAFPIDYSEELGCAVYDNEIELNVDLYPEVTFENSPKELVVKL